MTAGCVAFAIPGDIETPSGGYSYDRHLLRGLANQGRVVTHIALGPSFPHPTPEDVADAALQLQRVPAECPVIIDGLALGALAPDVIAGMSAPVVALIHHPLAYEGGLLPELREYFLQTERENLRQASHVIVTSPHTGELLMAEYGVPRDHITIARPGSERVVQLRDPIDPPLILSVGIQVPRKGHDVLLRALAQIVDLPWQAVIAGGVMDETYGASLVSALADLGLASRARLAGYVSKEELSQLYSQASVFALATRFEGYGMVFGEAMAHGLPIVTCRTGAVSDTVAAGAGVLVDPDDPTLFATALRGVLEDAPKRQSMAAASARGGLLLDGWSETAERVGYVLDAVLSSSGGGRFSAGTTDD